MALILCSECRREVSDQAVSCPSCGNPVASARLISQSQPSPPVYAQPAYANIPAQHPAYNYQPQPALYPSYQPYPPTPYYAPAPQQPVVINNSNNVSSVSSVRYGRKRRSFLVDLFMICITGGLWIIWMLVRR